MRHLGRIAMESAKFLRRIGILSGTHRLLQATVALALLGTALCAAGNPAGNLGAVWTLDDSATNAISGAVQFAPGVSGQCLILDGLTTHLTLPARKTPKLTDRFTVSGWVALGSYPLNQAPLVDWYDPNRCGLFFGLNAHGRIELAVRAGHAWQSLVATDVVSFRQWHLITGVLDNGELRICLDGKAIATRKLDGAFVPPRNLDMFVGKHRFPQKATGTIRPGSSGDASCLLDGALSGLKIHDRALSEVEIQREFHSVQLPGPMPLPSRALPKGPPGAFGAFYTRLKFYPQWDAPWRVSGFPDVVVRFDQKPFQCIFWRGTSYIPNWVTENDIWYNNEFNETWCKFNGVYQGCCEPMSDKQTRYAHVRILESSEARCVVHWRYALASVFYNIARADLGSGWGDWSDELYTIYPDGSCIRDITLHSSKPEEPHEWQESLVVMGQGRSPENTLDPVALTLVNASGQTASYSWKHALPPVDLPGPPQPCIQLINTKSRYRPYTILRPQDNPFCKAYKGEVRREYSIFPWWNHWPASMYASDRRYAMAADSASHTSLTHLFWDAYQAGPQWMRKIMLNGLTDQPATSLLPLTRSWSRPAPLVVVGGDFTSEGFDPAQKAYVLSKAMNPKNGDVQLRIDASEQSPVVNPAFVIKNWGEAGARLFVAGKETFRKDGFRLGHRSTIDGHDIIVWLPLQAAASLTLSIQANKAR